ncbi:MAG: META domain-containing protein [Bacteroidota bacterium]
MRSTILAFLGCILLLSACNETTTEPQEPQATANQDVPKKDENLQLTPFTPLAKELIVSGVNDHWTLTIASDGTSSFRSYELNKLFPSVAFDSSNELVTLSNEEEKVVVNLKKEDCQRNPSSPTSMLTSDFEMAGRTWSGCATWKKDTRLFGEWELSEFQGESFQDTSQYSGTPFLMIDHKGITGRAGCNQFRANFYTIQDAWFMESSFMTKASCPRISLEQRLMNFLTEGGTTYSVNEASLTIKSTSSTATFKKKKS